MRQKLFILLAGLALGLLLKDWAPSVTRLTNLVSEGDTPAILLGRAISPEAVLPRVDGLNQPKDGSSRLLIAASSPSAEQPVLAWVIPAVVRVTGPAFAGSGVIIDASGLVLTSAHVVGDATEVSVEVEDTRRLTGRVVRADAQRDLALVQLPRGSYPAAFLSSGKGPLLGSPAIAVGYPLGLPGPASVTTGVVSRLLAEPELGRTMLQTDAAINLGNSGGPIVDQGGAIIGIVASVMGDYQSVPARGISFAVSAETIRQEFLAGS
ncbi:MAG TPA: trypsin-like peptidase domain-containing protein [Dehalococcoidia bacterium]|nr:trypsin-like peptidase domain-containing protein [Dehalococcoidia bacterium]